MCRVRLTRLAGTVLYVWSLLIAAPELNAQALAELATYTVPIVALKGRPLGDPSNFAQPADVAFVAGKLVVIDRRTDLMIHVLDAETGRTVKRFGRRGSGPGEFQAPWEVLSSVQPREFWIFDTSLRRLSRANESLDFAEGRYTPQRTIQLAGGHELNSLQWTNDRRILCSGFLRSGLFAVFDSAGRQEPTRGVFDFGDVKIPVFTRQQAYTSKIAIDASRRRIALVTAYSDRVEFFDVSGKRLGTAERPFGFEPTFVLAGKGADRMAAFTADSRDAYTAVEATDDRVYALFSGRRAGDFKSESGFARQVHVYSWSGRLLHVLALDSDVLDMAIDPDERHLYAVRHDPMPQVLVYKLPERGREVR